MALTHIRADIPGRIVAIITFIIGIVLLLAVFTLALHLFREPIPGLGLPLAAGKQPPAALNIGAALVQFSCKLLVLALMTLAGSLIASRGIHLYFGTNSSHPHPTQTNSEKEPAKTG